MTNPDPVREVNEAVRREHSVYLDYDTPTTEHRRVRVVGARRRKGVLSFRALQSGKWVVPSFSFSLEVQSSTSLTYKY